MGLLLEVRGAPAYYACGNGVLNNLEQTLTDRNKKRILCIHGEKSLQAARPFLPDFTAIQASFTAYNGECSKKEIERIAHLAEKVRADVIFGIGGGKVLDLAKAVGNCLQVPVILIPTLASNCAAWTPSSVIYDDEGCYSHDEVHPMSTWMVLVEPLILLNSPVLCLRTGIVGTLAKWYETDALIARSEQKSLSIQIAHETAQTCRTVLLQHGKQALIDLAAVQPTPSLIKVIETIIMAGGMVSGYGGQYGKSAAARSIHNGLTKAGVGKSLLYDEKIAYGILIQLILEQNWNEIELLLPFYHSVRLPVLLSDLGITKTESDLLARIAEASSMTEEPIHLIFPSIKKDEIVSAMLELESFVTSKIQVV